MAVTPLGALAEQVALPASDAKPISPEALTYLATLSAGRFPRDRDAETLREARDLVLDIYRTTVDNEPRSLAMLKSVWI